MSRIKAGPNDCIDSIAFAHGLFWQTVWDHPENRALKDLRRDPNVLDEDDEVFVPEIEIKEESGATEQRHRFRRKGVPAKIKIRVMVDDEPVADTPCVLIIDGRSTSLTTDGDGFVEIEISPGARRGELRVQRQNRTTIYHLNLGGLPPLDTEDGVRDRLGGLGYATSTDEEFLAARRRFRADHNLAESDAVDDALRDKLKEVFGQ